MAPFWERAYRYGSGGYIPVPPSEKEQLPPIHLRPRVERGRWSRCNVVYLVGPMFLLYGLSSLFNAFTSKDCDTVDQGYTCSPSISEHWGQYAPWYAVPSEIHVDPPKGCEVTFANVLSRHGARDPTWTMSIAYGRLIHKLQDILHNSTDYPEEFNFLKEYDYDLGAERLTDMGRQEMVNSGAHFFRRYFNLAQKHNVFVRATDQDRVLESAEKWIDGYAQALDRKPEVGVIISESSPNNTLSPAKCPSFEDASNLDTLREWRSHFVPPIQERFHSALHADQELSTYDVLDLMDMCPFHTVAHRSAKVSSFCRLFTEAEWHQYDYYRTLTKYYGYGPGHPYGPTQGVGYVNELLARLSEEPVQDGTTTNSTLDSDVKTFPLDRKLYADFSHDNDMASILAALGVYNRTPMLPGSSIVEAEDAYGFSAAWTVPFAARIYVEKLQCGGEDEEFVRVIVNDRVQPLEFCGGDEYGRCTLKKFFESQNFARGGGLWHQCNV